VRNLSETKASILEGLALPATTTREFTPPRYSDAGWLQWPDDEDYSFHFMRVLAAAQEGASTISECFLTARSITPGDAESWFDAWKRLADSNSARGNEAFARGGLKSATSNWLRASNYYRTAEIFLATDDPRRALLFEKMRTNSQRHLENLRPKGEVVKIRDGNTSFSEGYFVKAPTVRRSQPVVICIGGMEVPKDELLYTMVRHAAANNLSLLLIDPPDSAAGGSQDRNSSGIVDAATYIARWVDYLLSRGDVSPGKIAIYGDGLGGTYATRAASCDHRFSAAVCDGGLWDHHERLFLEKRLAKTFREEMFVETKMMGQAFQLNLECPYLVMIGEHDYINVEYATSLVESAEEAGLRPSLKVFSSQETAASPGHADNPTLAKEFAFEWIRRMLAVN
jgi:dienelactone hydrolase